MYIVGIYTELQFLILFLFSHLLFIKIICGRCNKSMTFKEYEDTHSATHYSLCWIKGDEKPVSIFYPVVYIFKIIW